MESQEQSTGKNAQNSTKTRLWGLALAVACGLPLAAGFWLMPRHAGHGTHVQMGLPACSYLARTGYPCPGCGMTTSLAATVHGQFALAAKAQPFGLVATLALFFATLAGLAQAASGRRILTRYRPRLWWLAAALCGWLGGWVIKLAAGVADGTYPVGR